MSESKQIEPTDAMVDEAASALSIDANGTSLHRRSDVVKHVYLKIARIALRAALRHPDAPGLFADEDALRAAREQGWDEAAQHIYNKGWEGVTALRKANPHRPAQELPTEDGAVIVPADGCKFIRGTIDGTFDRLTFNADSGHWIGWDRSAKAAVVVEPRHITPGTWKVDNQ